ncbi:MAG: BON domain-containing protein [Methylophilaceae bacterium]|jgi:osmotically-inducible protein OsmY|nr:BON domain-containing protein [Methylophilaceae bacterium]
MIKSYNFFILIFLFITQLVGCAAVGVTGVVAPPLSFADRRSTEIQIIDQKNEFKAIIEIQETYKDANVSFVSFNQTLVITGEVPSDELKTKVEGLAKNVEGVEEVKNFLIVGKNSSLRSKSLDVISTANVKSRIFAKTNAGQYKDKISATHIKVFTERQEVYLMGLVTKEEADVAIKIAKSSKGAKKIIPLFEINEGFKK